jgi:hypothetical protein
VKNYSWNEKSHLFAYTFLLPRTLGILHASPNRLLFGITLALLFRMWGSLYFILFLGTGLLLQPRFANVSSPPPPPLPPFAIIYGKKKEKKKVHIRANTTKRHSLQEKAKAIICSNAPFRVWAPEYLSTTTIRSLFFFKNSYHPK